MKRPKPLKSKNDGPIPIRTNSAPPDMEKLHRVIARIAKGFNNLDDLNEHLAELSKSGKLNRLMGAAPEGRRERAQDLAAQAMSAPKIADARKLARQALRIDPDCVDAKMVLARCSRLSDSEYAAAIREVVESGAQTLGEDFFRANRGRFWGLLETRPYMRARFELMMALASAGELQQAISEAEGMLDLNPGDNQGVRDYLLALYLAMKNLEGAERLLSKYGQEDAVFAWGAVFYWMLKGDRMRGEKALHSAMKVNLFAAVYFGAKRPAMPDSYSPGSDEEAQYAGTILAPAWAAHPDVVVWIAKRLQALIS